MDWSKTRGPVLEYDQSPVAVEEPEANLTSSALVDEQQRDLGIGWAPTFGAVLHAPAIDLDVPARLVPSSTPGHSHLYIDVPMSWEKYVNILRALYQGGVIDYEYFDASVRQGATYLRPEGIVKGVNDVKPAPAAVTNPDNIPF